MFETSLQEVLKNEGEFVKDPDDNGGATNYGITIKTLSDFIGKPATENDIINISMDTVKAIYRQNYWDRLQLDQIKSKNLASLLFDQAVNRGTRKVAEQIQKLVGVKQDGMIGPITIQAINERDSKKLILEFIKASQDSYIRIALSDHTQIKFLTGWINRTQKFLNMI